MRGCAAGTGVVVAHALVDASNTARAGRSSARGGSVSR
nr:TPA_asm: m69.4 sORF 1 [Murid betaherpesvirus 1]DBA07810.1 TPA_asm: m69.4 sORF 1 [Murid betaherpesvirus 1]